jgi:hypothetical protein
MMLDTSPDLDRFPAAIVVDYHYHDLGRALARLERYAENGTLICIASADPLFQRLASDSIAAPRIHVFDRLTGEREDLKPLREQLQAILELLSREARPVPAAKPQRVTEVQISGQSVKVLLANSTPEPVPVLIKASYFPHWVRVDSREPVYMVTPTYMLTYAQSDFAVGFKADASVWIGYLVSLVCVSLVAVAWGPGAALRRTLRRNRRPSGCFSAGA